MEIQAQPLETMSESVLAFAKAWHEPNAEYAEEVEAARMPSETWGYYTHGKELRCSLMLNEQTGTLAIFYNVIGDQPPPCETCGGDHDCEVHLNRGSKE